jgi:transcriptional regulator with XRE-family HTH domain
MGVAMNITEKDLAKTIGAALSKRRKAAGLTQEYVAERLNIGSEAVSRIERGLVVPTVVRLVELAEIYECPVDDLLIESSNRLDDQSRIIAGLLGKLSDKDRALVLEIVERLSARLGARK